jgi:hypothetical protein
MKKITTIDKKNLSLLRAEIEAALKNIGKEYGLEIEIGNMRYSANTFATTINARIPGYVNPSVAYLSEAMGLAPIGSKISSGGWDFEVVRHELSRPKYPIVARNLVTGKLFKFPASVKPNEAIK